MGITAKEVGKFKRIMKRLENELEGQKKVVKTQKNNKKEEE